jgi:Poxvirus A32 protein
MPIDLDIVNKTVSLVAKRGSGKSILLKYLVDSCKEKFEKIFVISPTNCVDGYYSDMVEEKNIFSSWDETWCEALITRMTEQNKGKKKEERKNILLIIDDVCSDTNFHQSNSLKKLYARGRHINISIIITCQYLISLPPICRNNCDWLLAGQMNRQSVQLLCDEYMTGDLGKPEFIKLYNRATRDYGFLVINNTSIKENDDLNQIYGIIKTPKEFVA